MMTLVRVLLLAILVYYAVKLLARWIFRPGGAQRPRAERGSGRERDQGRRFRDFTNQAIEDADYEDLDAEDEE